jgi:hypothetical protein
MIAPSRFALALLLAGALPAFAQTKAPAKAPGGLTFSGVNSIYRSNGVRLEGTPAQPARVTSPEIDCTAQVIAFDLAGNAISEVRAQTGVNLKLNMTPADSGPPTHVEVTCANATLTPKPMKLVLVGNVNGFYQVAGGAKNTISGDRAVLTQPNKNIVVDVEGGPKGVVLVVPAENMGRPDALGDLTVTAQRAHIDQATGNATFTGNAHAVSKGANAFDVAATEFTLTRAADGTLSTLTTTGRTQVKLDLPPDPTPATPAPAPEPAPTTGKDGKPVKAKPNYGKPTHVEVAADGAVIERATSTATFTGNVKGFYLLAPIGGVAAPYNFAGSKAIVTYVVPPAGTVPTGNAAPGLSVQVTGAPVSIDAPAFNFGF